MVTVKRQNVPFFTFARQVQQLKPELEKVFAKVIDSGQYILGEEVAAFEKEFAAYIGTRFAVGVASGTDALTLALRALDITAGDEVITVANTATPTVVAILQAGAVPVFADIEKDGFHMEPSSLEKRITPRTKAIMPVHLYGQTAKMGEIGDIAQKHKLPIIEDACQAHGAEHASRKAGNLGLMGAFSFYPTKNLGCFGDGGMITLSDDKLYQRLLLLRNYGQKSKYEHVSVGINSRLDELQAAILRIKLKYLDQWNSQRADKARQYSEKITNASIQKPCIAEPRKSAHHLYVVRSRNRDQLQTWLSNNGVGTMIHYPTPVHLQPAFEFLGYKRGDLPNTEKCMAEILSLPLYPELSLQDMEIVGDSINHFDT